MVTVSHLYDSTNVHSVKPENNVLNTWIEVCHHYFQQVDLNRKSAFGMNHCHTKVTTSKLYLSAGDFPSFMKYIYL